jgi:hypothetical protein
MKIKSERGQAAVLVVLGIIVVAILFLGMAGNMPGMKQGADTIAESITDGSSGNGEIEYLVMQAEQSLAVHARIGTQPLSPNKHSVNRHREDAWAATNCYNNFGFFQMWQTKSEFGSTKDLHGLCADTNGTVYDIIFRQRDASNEYDLVTALKPKNGILKNIIYWLKGKPGATVVNPPTNATVYIDGVAP